MQAALVAGNQVIVMLILMASGFFLYKIKIFNDTVCAGLSKFLLTFVIVAVLLDSYNRDYDPQIMKNIGISIVIALCGYIIGIPLSLLLIRGNTAADRVDRISVFLPNCGFMGIPLVKAFVGDEGVIYVSAAVIVFTVMQWTVAQIMITGEKIRAESLKKLILNPGVLGCAAGIILFLLPFNLPGQLADAVGHVAAVNTPLAMILLGSTAAKTDFRSALTRPRLWLVCALRLLAVPFATLFIFAYTGISDTLLTAGILVVACPTAVAVSMFPGMLGLEQGDRIGAATVTVSTLLSVVTIPLIVLVKSLITG